MADEPKLVRLEKSVQVNTYAHLWHASECVLAKGLSDPKGSSWQFLSSLILTAFSLEAYLNHIGPGLYHDWPKVERLGPLEKLERVLATSGLRCPAGRRPRSTLNELINLRNDLAHARSATAVMNPKVVDARADVDKMLGERSTLDWQNRVKNADFANRARKDVRVIVEKIHAKLPEPKDSLFSFGMGSGKAAVASPHQF